MLEREITSQNGVISKNLPEGTYWQRLPDSPRGNQQAHPYDGLFWMKNKCWGIETKMEKGKLSEGEKKYAEKCVTNKTEYIILRYYSKFKIWSIEIYNSNITYESENLKECLEFIIYRD